MPYYATCPDCGWKGPVQEEGLKAEFDGEPQWKRSSRKRELLH